MSNFRKTLRLGTFAVLASLMILLSSCDLDDDNNDVQPVPLSYVSIYNAIPNAPDLDISVDNRLISPRALEFGDNTYYQNSIVVLAIEITPYGASNVVADTTPTLVDGNIYSVFMVDEFDKAQILVTMTAQLYEEGKGKIRLIIFS